MTHKEDSVFQIDKPCPEVSLCESWTLSKSGKYTQAVELGDLSIE